MVSAGAKVLGSFTIGENSKIGAGSVVLEEVPPNCTVVGVPGRVVKMNDEKIPRLDMDQVHLPDPISNDIRELQADNIRMHRQIQEMEKHMGTLKTKREQQLFTKAMERKLKEQYAPVLRRMTFSQGKLLIKLIDRETDQTSYDLVKQLRGGFRAFFWQSIARLFGANLKAPMTPKATTRSSKS